MTYDPNELSNENMSTQDVIDPITPKYRDLSMIQLCLIVASLTMTIVLVLMIGVVR